MAVTDIRLHAIVNDAAERRRLRSDYRTALAGGKLMIPEDSTPALQETAALREL